MSSGEMFVKWQRNISFFTSRGAGHTFTYGWWRVRHWLQKRIARSYEVDAADLLASLDLDAVSAEQSHDAAFAKLAAHFRSRPNPVFMFDEGRIGETIQQVPAKQKEQTVHAANRICQNIFDLRGSGPVRFHGSIDWSYSPGGNIDWRWDLNRHVFFETLGRAYWYSGDEQYADKFAELVYDWLDNNPVRLDQPNWHSVFEVAVRSNVWVWALHYFRQSRVFDVELCQRLMAGLLAHGRYLNDNIELHVPNNHLLLEAKALAFLGIMLPEFKEAGRWRERGLKLLERQVLEQVCQDGVHGERTTLYHRIIAGELLELLVLMENNRIPASDRLVDRFARMVEFEQAVAKPDGTFPLLGDSAATDTYLRFSASGAGPVFLSRRPGDRRDDLALQESDYWLLGSERLAAHRAARPSELKTATRPSVAFPVGGYYLMSAGEGTDAHHLVFDCGPFGLEAMPNHGHADALSFDLYAYGQTLLLDPGLYSTALGLDWRNSFRGTSSHNTVVVDDLDQSHLMDERRVYRPARATCLDWISNAEFDFVDGMHDGYKRLSQPVTHRRQVFFAKPYYWVVVDTLTGRGKHRFDLYFHMLPRAKALLDPTSRRIRVVNRGGTGLLIVPRSTGDIQAGIATGATNPIQGWVSFSSGVKEPAPVLRLRREAETPVQFCTVLYPFRAGHEPSIQVSPLQLEGRRMDDPTLTAIAIETPARLDHLIIDRAPRHKARVEFASHAK